MRRRPPLQRLYQASNARVMRRVTIPLNVGRDNPERKTISCSELGRQSADQLLTTALKCFPHRACKSF